MRDGIRAVIFDMDGVLIDSEADILAAWRETMEAAGQTYRAEVFEQTCGTSPKETVRILARYYGALDWNGLMNDLIERYAALVRREGQKLKPFAREILAALRAEGVPLALATSNLRGFVEEELAAVGLLDCFDRIVTGDEVTHSKPDPEVFFRACAALGVAPRETVIIEDSFAGVRAAYASGARVLMVPDVLQPTEEIRALAECVLLSLDEAREYLLGEKSRLFCVESVNNTPKC